MGASIIPKSLDDQVVSAHGANVACTVFPWLLALGWCLAFSALFSKTYRINKIFHNPSFKRVKIEAQDVMVPMMVLLSCNVLILTVWTALDPLYWDRYVVGYDPFGRPNETRGRCYSENWLPYLISLAVVNAGALVVAIHQAWIARKISLEFAESEWIARVMNTILLVAFVGGPVLVIADEDPRAFYFVLCALIFAICMSLLGFIFGPKIAKTRSMNKKQQSSKGAIKETLSNINKNSRNSDSNKYTGTESDPLDVTNHSGDSNISNYSNLHSTGGASEGAKVIVHPALEKEKAAEMRQLKKEKKKLKNMISMLQRKSTQGFTIDDVERKGLLEEVKEEVEQNEHLQEETQHWHSETMHLQEDNVQLQDDLKQLEQQLEKQHHQQEEEKQKILEDLREAKEELLRKQQREEDLQKLVSSLEVEKKELQDQLQQKTQDVEEEKKNLNAETEDDDNGMLLDSSDPASAG